MATHSISILIGKIPETEESGRLQSMGSQSRTRLSTTYSKCRTIKNHSSIEFIRKCFQNDCDVILVLFTH